MEIGLASGLRLTLRWVEPARPTRAGGLRARDHAGVTWLACLLIIALGLWGMIRITPEAARGESDDYLRSPARFAALLVPPRAEPARPRFAPPRPAEAPPAESRPAARPGPRPVAVLGPEARRERDARDALNHGILRWLKERGGGPGGDAFGGARPADLDSLFEGLAHPAGAGSPGWGDLGLRGGPGGPRGLGLGGQGGRPWGPGPGGPEAGLARLATRGRVEVKLDAHARTRILGGLSQKVVGDVMQRHWLKFKYCYEKQLGREPDLRGKVVASFTIGPAGRVEEASVLQSTASSPDLEACLLRSLRRLLFPTPRGGGEVIVTYPFLFSTVE
jgi:TonB family protein